MSNVATTIEQSRKLIELGLDPKTADCNWNTTFGDWSLCIGKNKLPHAVPAWSLSALLEVAPIKITKDKMEYAEGKGKLIPDAYFILCLIHGESDHIEFDENTKQFKEKPVIYKLNNIVIKRMVAELFDYKSGFDVSRDKLH